MKNTKEKKGMSLIVLVITIIVMIVLAGVVVIGLSNNNPISKANEASFKTDVGNFKQELSLNLATKFGIDPSISKDDINAATLEEIKEYIPSFKDVYTGQLEIKKGELVFVGDREELKNWAESMGTPSVAVEENFMQNFKINEGQPFFESVYSSKDDEVLIAGRVNQNARYDVGAILIDRLGNKKKERFIGITGNVKDCLILQNGNYAVIGSSVDNNALFLILDQNLNILKENRVIGNRSDIFTKVLQLSNGDILILMQMASDDLGITNPSYCTSVIYRYNQQGDFIEKKEIAPMFNGSQIIPVAMKVLTSGEVILAGRTNYGRINRRFAAVKFNPNTLDTIYEKYYDLDVEINSKALVEVENGCIVVSLNRNSPTNGTTMVKIDSQGNEIQRKQDRIKSESETVEYQSTLEYIDGKLVAPYYFSDTVEHTTKLLMVTYDASTLEIESYYEVPQPYERLPESIEKIGNYYYFYANAGNVKKYREV